MWRSILLLYILLVFDVVYNLAGGRGAFYFAPFLTLQIAAFVGLLKGPSYGLWWGAAAGFFEELLFVSAGDSFGLTPLVYLWAGWTGGKFFHGRTDPTNPIVGIFLTFCTLIFALIAAALLGWAYGHPLSMIPLRLTLLRIVTFSIQILLAPVLLRLLMRFLKVQG